MPVGRTIFHISAWTWCRKTMWGQWAHRGEKKGIPFQISTRPSPEPTRPRAPDAMTRGKTEYRPARRITR
jgi:hypothetical protein